jgi:hypothetical protein
MELLHGVNWRASRRFVYHRVLEAGDLEQPPLSIYRASLLISAKGFDLSKQISSQRRGSTREKNEITCMRVVQASPLFPSAQLFGSCARKAERPRYIVSGQLRSRASRRANPLYGQAPETAAYRGPCRT